jgi:hypothetical protein
MNIHDRAQKIARATSRPVSEILSELGRRGARKKNYGRTVVSRSHSLDASDSVACRGWMQRWEDGR